MPLMRLFGIGPLLETTQISIYAFEMEDQNAMSHNGGGPMANVRAKESDEKQFVATIDA
jgi:hypothetical protein